MRWTEIVEEASKITSSLLGVSFFIAGSSLVVSGKRVIEGLFNYAAFIIPEEFINTARASLLLGLSNVLVTVILFLGMLRRSSFLLVLNTSVLVYLCLCGYFVGEFAKQDAGQLSPQLYYGLKISQKRFGEESELGREFRQGWNFAQHKLKCCGVSNYTDWIGVKKRTKNDPQVPVSCCKRMQESCSNFVDFDDIVQSNKYIYVEGCYEKAKADIPLHYISVGIIVFEITAGLLAVHCAFFAWWWRNFI